MHPVGYPARRGWAAAHAFFRSAMTETTTACPACKGLVSFAAVECPHCGHPLDQPALTKGGQEAGAPVRQRTAAPDQSWHMSHLYFLGRYLLAIVVPVLPLLWNLAVFQFAPASADGTASDASIPTGVLWRTVLILLGAVSLPLWLSAFVQRIAAGYTLTQDGYVRERRGIIARKTAEIHVSDIRLVNLHQSFWQRLFNVGSLDISSAGHSGVEVQFIGIPGPEAVKERILDRAEGSDD
jgi:hypothetical protein